MEFNATFIVSAVSFVVFTLIMNKILYQPVSDIIAKRKEYIDNNSAVTKENLDNARAIVEAKDKEILVSKTEAKNTLMSAVENANHEKANKEVQLKEEMNNKVSEQKVVLNDEKQKTTMEMKANIDDISDSILSKLSIVFYHFF